MTKTRKMMVMNMRMMIMTTGSDDDDDDLYDDNDDDDDDDLVSVPIVSLSLGGSPVMTHWGPHKD